MNQERHSGTDLAKGCGIRLLLLVLMLAGFYLLLCLRAPFPTLVLFADGAEVAAPVAAFSMWFAALWLLYARQNERDLAALTRGLRHGERALVIGNVKPEGPLLTAPFSGAECVGYYYTVTHRGTTAGRSIAWTDYEGYALRPFAIRSSLGDVKILAEADKELFYELRDEELSDAYDRAHAYLQAADFGEEVAGALGGASRTRKTVDGTSSFRVDTSIGNPPEDLRSCRLHEKVILPGEPVYSVGVYSAQQNGISADPNIMSTPFHIVRGDERALKRKTRMRLAGALICACVSIAVIAFYFLLYVPKNPGRAIW